MKRSSAIRVLLASALLLSALALPGTAKERQKGRVITIEYSADGGMSFTAGGVSVTGSPGEGYGFRSQAGERYLSLKAVDDLTGPIAVEIAYQTDQSSAWFVCGETVRPLRIRPNQAFVLTVWHAVCPSGDRSIPVGGTIEVTLSSRN